MILLFVVLGQVPSSLQTYYREKQEKERSSVFGGYRTKNQFHFRIATNPPLICPCE